MKRFVTLTIVFVLVVAACGGDEGEAESDGTDGTVVIDADGNGSDGDGGNATNDSDGSTTSSGPDNDDFGDISGNSDLDPGDLGGQAGDLADAVDDIVSVGDCVAFGLMATPPPDYKCRVLDNPTATMDGFTLFTEGNITIGTPSPLGEPCELLQACDDAVPIELSDNFPDTMLLNLFGTVMIYGNHASGAELVITKASALTDEDTQLIMDFLDSVTEA